MSKPNILFLSSWYPNSELPFNGNFVQQHAKAVSLYCNVVVLHVQGRNQVDDFQITDSKNDNIKEVIVYFKRKTNRFDKVFKFFRYSKALNIGFQIASEHLNNKIDFIHLNVILPIGWYALYLHKRYKIPYVITEHHTKYLQKNAFSFFEIFMIKKIVKNAFRVCPVSNDLKVAFEKHGFYGNFEIVANVVDTNVFYFDSKNKNNEFEILHVSSLQNSHKNVFGIINVFKKLIDIYPNIFLRIIGDGNKEAIVDYLIENKINSANYTVEGPFNYHQIADSMRKASVFVLFSNYENLPCVISEALISGLPVISSNVGGIPEMINNENGFLVQANDEQSLFNQLKFVINNTNQFNNEKIAKDAVEKYSFQNIAYQFFTIYNEKLQQPIS